MRDFFMVSGLALAIEALLTVGVANRLRKRRTILAREAPSRRTDRRM